MGRSRSRSLSRLPTACDHSRDFAGHWNPQDHSPWWNVEDVNVIIPGKIGRIYGPTRIAIIEPLKMQPVNGFDSMLGNEDSCSYVHRTIKQGRKGGYQVCV